MSTKHEGKRKSGMELLRIALKDRSEEPDLLAAYREMREALASIVKSDLCGEIYDDGSVVSSTKLQSAKQALDKYPEL